MRTDTPIACSLTGAEMPARLAGIASLGRDALDSARTNDARAVLRFRAGARTRERLEAIVDAEARCCSFLRMELRDQPGAVLLTIEAPEGADALMGVLVAAFCGDERAAA
jgi:hypothetical protein